MTEISQLENIFETILDDITVLRNDINTCLQGNISQEMNGNINKHFDAFYYGIKYQMNEFKMEINTSNNNDTESVRLKEELQKANYIIQLQTLSSNISRKISALIEKSLD